MSITETSGSGGDEQVGAGDVCHTFTLWPHRSLPPSGLAAMLTLVSLGTVIPLLHLSGPALWVVGVPCLAMPVALWLAFRANNAAARIVETVLIGPHAVSVERSRPGRPSEIQSFSSTWVRVVVRTEAQFAYRVLLAEGCRRAAIGDFLSPDERLDLAEALGRVLGHGRVDMTAARPLLHDFDATDYA